MSVATISYASLGNASSEAKDVANRLDTYADNLTRSVYNKLNGYKGDHTGNIGSAIGSTSSKIAALREKEAAYRSYAKDLEELEGQCRSKDQAVRSKISKLTGDFKKANGIKNSKVQNWINYHLTGLKNSSSAGRWINDKADTHNSIKEYIKQCIEDWWDYEGGKQLVIGSAIALLEIVAGVCAVVAAVAAAVASGAWTVALVAAVVGGAIAVINGIFNLVNENRAYDETHNNGDPALGRRRSDENTAQDYLRTETDSKFLHAVATGIDIVNFVCAAISIIDGAGKLLKNAYKWTTGSMTDIKNLRVRDLLTRENFGQFFGKLKDTVKIGWNDFTDVLKSGKLSNFTEFFFDFGDDFMNNLKNAFTNFDSVKDGAKTIKNITNIPKILLEEGFSLKSVVWDIGVVSLVLPNINMGETVTYKPHEFGGVFDYDISAIKVTDMSDIIDKTFSKIIGADIWKGNSILGKDVLNKLSSISDIQIGIPEISIPSIELNHVSYMA